MKYDCMYCAIIMIQNCSVVIFESVLESARTYKVKHACNQRPSHNKKTFQLGEQWVMLLKPGM